jgi:hypothetical protein
MCAAGSGSSWSSTGCQERIDQQLTAQNDAEMKKQLAEFDKGR